MKIEEEPSPRVRYAAVVPNSALAAAKRVPTWVRSILRLDIYAIHDDGEVERHGSTPLTDPDNWGGYWIMPTEGDQTR